MWSLARSSEAKGSTKNALVQESQCLQSSGLEVLSYCGCDFHVMYPLNQCSCLFEKYSMIALANSRTIDRMLSQTSDSIYTHLPTSFPSVQKPCLGSIYMRALCFEPSLELPLMRLLQVTVGSLHIELRFVEPCRRQTKKSRIFLLSLTAISKRIKQRPVCDISWFFPALTSLFVPHS